MHSFATRIHTYFLSLTVACHLKCYKIGPSAFLLLNATSCPHIGSANEKRY